MAKWVKVYIKEARRFMTDCIEAAGGPRLAAEQVADVLVEADKLGHRSHGLNRIGRYVKDIQTGRCNPRNTPKILKETMSTAWIDADNVLGPTAGNFCLDIAIKKAEKTGVGWVATKGSNHYGIGGYWAKKVADAGMIGMTFTNSSPLLAPTRSTKAALGTNPVAVAAPGLKVTGPFYLDVATSVVALGKIEICRRRGIKLQPGWALGPDGKETLDPETMLKHGSLLPLGGEEKTSGYKGFGLAALVDLLSGILAGSRYGHHVPRWSPEGKLKADIGQTFVALNHKCFAPGFEERVSDCITYWRQMKPADPKLPVLAPGDIERSSLLQAEKTGILNYVVETLDSCDRLATELKVKPMNRIKLYTQRKIYEKLLELEHALKSVNLDILGLNGVRRAEEQTEECDKGGRANRGV